MPHTSHKKKHWQEQEQGFHRNKRGEVVSDDGWKRIARSNQAGGTNPSHQPAMDVSIHNLKDGVRYDDEGSDEGDTRRRIAPRPAELPDGATLEKAVFHYQKYEITWKQSRTWMGLKQIFNSRILPQDLDITECICFGLSSPTGLVRGNVDRRNVAMYQLAAFKSVIDIVTERQGQRPDAYAQEPVFNAIDDELLAHLNITMVHHPKAFELITSKSFTFCPGAEQSVVRGTLSRSPAMYMGSSALETYHDSETGELRSPNMGTICTMASDPPARHPPHPDNKGPLERSGEENDEIRVDESAYEEARAEPGNSWTVFSVKGAGILHEFKKGKECFQLPDTEALEYALYNAHLFWRSSNAPKAEEEEED